MDGSISGNLIIENIPNSTYIFQIGYINSDDINRQNVFAIDLSGNTQIYNDLYIKGQKYGLLSTQCSNIVYQTVNSVLSTKLMQNVSTWINPIQTISFNNNLNNIKLYESKNETNNLDLTDEQKRNYITAQDLNNILNTFNTITTNISALNSYIFNISGGNEQSSESDYFFYDDTELVSNINYISGQVTINKNNIDYITDQVTNNKNNINYISGQVTNNINNINYISEQVGKIIGISSQIENYWYISNTKIINDYNSQGDVFSRTKKYIIPTKNYILNNFWMKNNTSIDNQLYDVSKIYNLLTHDYALNHYFNIDNTKIAGKDYIPGAEYNLALFDDFNDRISALERKTSSIPIGSILIIPYQVTDDLKINYNLLICDGSWCNTEKYPQLFNVLSTLYTDITDTQNYKTDSYGNSLTFQIPDFRGQFLRGYLSGVSAEIGIAQLDQNKAHIHTSRYPNGVYFDYQSGSARTRAVSDKYYNVNTTSQGGIESRPKNYSIYYCIKFA